MKTLKKNYTSFCRYIGASLASPSNTQVQCFLFLFGVTLLVFGTLDMTYAAAPAVPGGGGSGGGTITYNDERITNATNAILTYIEGSFGALIMIAAGLGAIISSAFGQYRAALGLLVVAVGAFILRSLVSTFFNDDNILPNT